MVQRTSEKISEMDLLSTQTEAMMVPVTMGEESYRVEMPFPGGVASLSASATGTVNAAVLQSAIDAASVRYTITGVIQTVVVPPGGPYKIQLTNTASWVLPLNGSSVSVSVAVKLKTGVHIACKGATFAPIPPAGGSALWYYAIFGTEDLNLSVDELSGVRISEATFDMSTTYWTLATTAVYAVLAVGVTNLTVDSARVKATGTQNGRFLRAINCANVAASNMLLTNITQATHFAYIYGLIFSGTVDGFTEAFDLDQPCWNVIGDVICKNASGGDKQCLDLSSIVNGSFRLQCENVGNAFILYPKPESWQTYSEWVTNAPSGSPGSWSPDPVMCENVSIEVNGTDIHSSDLRTFQVGLDRMDASYGTYWNAKGPMVRDVRLDVRCSDCDMGRIYEGRNFSGVISLRDVTTGTTSAINDAAVVLRQPSDTAQNIADGELSGVLDVYVENSDRAGVRVLGGEGLSLAVTVDGYNSSNDAGSGRASGLWWSNLALKAGAPTLRKAAISNGATVVTPVDLRLSGSGSVPMSLLDLGGHRLTTVGATPVLLGTIAEPITLAKQYACPTVSWDTSAATVDIVLATFAAGARVGRVFVTNLVASLADAANFTSLSLIRNRAGATNTIGTVVAYDDVARAAGAVVTLGDGDDTHGQLQAGDLLILRCTPTGTGSVRSNISARVTAVEYAL